MSAPYEQDPLGRWVPSVPLPYWFRSRRTLWRSRPGCYECRLICADENEYAKHYLDHHAVREERR